MKSFRFENIWLLSHRDKKARHFNFHPHKNLILGRNHTGKSSLIRALFETLGAAPQGKLEQWDENTISLVEFNVDERRYFALHQRGYRAFFSADLNLLLATGNHGEWSRKFSELTGFNLVFSDKESEVTPADPACFFMPFYINQDGSWQSEWNTFKGMKRFKAPWPAILEYFSGVCPPEYYELKAEKDQEAKSLDELKREQTLLERARERFNRTLDLTGPKLNHGNFEAEIARLSAEVTELNRRQEELRDAAVREQELLANLHLQINLATDALCTYDSDSAYLRCQHDEKLVCPTCGAEHGQSFMDLLAYAEDARILRDLVVRLKEDAARVQQQYLKTRASLSELDKSYREISQILETRRGDLRFGDVVDSLGAESAFHAFEAESALLQEEVNRRLGLVDTLDARLKELRSNKRTKAILANFREYYAAGRAALNLPPVDTSKMRLTSRPDLSGSGGPRSILAYYSAIWRTCFDQEGAYAMPVVIDSPNQQGQDDVNLPVVLKFIAQGLPHGNQLLVGLETPADYPFDREIKLGELYSLLQKAEFAAVNKHVAPLERAMYESLMG